MEWVGIALRSSAVVTLHPVWLPGRTEDGKGNDSVQGGKRGSICAIYLNLVAFAFLFSSRYPLIEFIVLGARNEDLMGAIHEFSR